MVHSPLNTGDNDSASKGNKSYIRRFSGWGRSTDSSRRLTSQIMHRERGTIRHSRVRLPSHSPLHSSPLFQPAVLGSKAEVVKCGGMGDGDGGGGRLWDGMDRGGDNELGGGRGGWKGNCTGNMREGEMVINFAT